MPALPLTIAEAADWLRSGRITSVGLTEAQLARAHATQDTLAAFITIMDQPALAAAKQADADFAAGIDRGPLQGIPIGVKDIIATRDAPTTANSRVLDRPGATATTPPWSRSCGRPAPSSSGSSDCTSTRSAGPTLRPASVSPRTPGTSTRTPGGSSSGTGAAVGGGVILGGLGTDTGGSIRGPASFCGISGIKQTFGRVSKEGCVPLGYSLDHIGPMARTARDCAIMLQVMAGYDPLDPSTVDVAGPGHDGAADRLADGVNDRRAARLLLHRPEPGRRGQGVRRGGAQHDGGGRRRPWWRSASRTPRRPASPSGSR